MLQDRPKGISLRQLPTRAVSRPAQQAAACKLKILGRQCTASTTDPFHSGSEESCTPPSGPGGAQQIGFQGFDAAQGRLDIDAQCQGFLELAKEAVGHLAGAVSGSVTHTAVRPGVQDLGF